MGKKKTTQNFAAAARGGLYRLDGATKPKGAVRRGIEGVRTFMNMLWDRSYRTTWMTKLTFLGGVAYLLIPSDLLPDVIPIVGLLDDAAVLGLVLAQFRQELSRYQFHLAGGQVTKASKKKKSAYQSAVEEVERTAPTPQPVSKTLGAGAYAR